MVNSLLRISSWDNCNRESGESYNSEVQTYPHALNSWAKEQCRERFTQNLCLSVFNQFTNGGESCPHIILSKRYPNLKQLHGHTYRKKTQCWTLKCHILKWTAVHTASCEHCHVLRSSERIQVHLQNPTRFLKDLSNWCPYFHTAWW